MKIVDSQEFQSIIREDKQVLVDFYADWCGPCKMMAPVLEELDKEKDNLTVIKVNVDNNPELASQYGVMSIPNLILFKDGIASNQVVGFMNKQALLDQLQLD